MHNIKILADSISDKDIRLTTFELTFPRIILSEFNTHRLFSRGSASSRAIPVEKMIKMVEENPYIPIHWGKNQKGMQAEQEVSIEQQNIAKEIWFTSMDNAIKSAKQLLDVGIHKQITNRLLEPFMWHTVICTATEWDNFIHLRYNKDAHPEIQIVAKLIKESLDNNKPFYNESWHLPLINDEEKIKIDLKDLIKISTGRCARVSYLTHDGKRDIQADIDLHDRLISSGHLSPTEHLARPMTDNEYKFYSSRTKKAFCGNFNGWIQYRKTIKNEDDILAP